jgi:hypothetical protein
MACMVLVASVWKRWYVWCVPGPPPLSVLPRCSGEWEKAIAVAEEHDRIHLKLTHHL